MGRRMQGIPLGEDAPMPSNSNKSIKEQRTDAVNGVFQLAQFAAIAGGQFHDAGAIGLHGPKISKALVDSSDKYPQIAKRVDLLIKAGPLAEVIAVGIPLVMQILCNHGIFKAEQMSGAGVVEPRTLEAQMKSTLMRQQLQAIKEQQDLEQELQRMEDEMISTAEDSPAESNE